ncbi:hypothetical protein [Hymenobacter latericus]|uniref:hypothetical protein n=1 Tax=Hymenobacter sp. YIM 151858-1 TaxID=2987688 RepID=UPI002227965D|nr:hypothetical protein [Hymenobacter sp. YIM 151858-1]UYZ59468.1 hypothetical protein OIS50_01410 [Hymenobacter sp. YIM 151858-1]
MKLYCLLFLLLLPQALRAQFTSFESGAYILGKDPRISYPAQLKLQEKKQLLVVRTPEGKTLKLAPEEVTYARIGKQGYLTAGSFNIGTKLLTGGIVTRAFVPVLDSGRIMLMRYEYKEQAVVITDPKYPSGASFTRRYLYLLQSPASYVATVLPVGTQSGNSRFREVLSLHLAARPDLVELVQQSRITESNLRAVIQAFNSNQPYPPATQATSTGH